MMHEITMPSPLGTLRLRANEVGLTGIYFDQHKAAPVPYEKPTSSAVLEETRRQLEAYFAGQRQHFDLPLDPQGSEFQRKVWTALSQIPYGVTCSYAKIAESIGSPKAARAVGHANSLNPLSIVVPCHRVVGASGKLTGYAGGLDQKRWLLEHEAR